MRLRFSWRLIALLTLVLYGVLVFITLRLITQNLLFALLLGLTGAFLLYAAWHAISARKRRHVILGTIAFMVGVIALVAELIYFMREPANRRSIIELVVFALVYIFLVGMLRNKFVRQLREHAVRVYGAAHFSRPVLIINPKSGDGRAIKAHVDRLATKMGIRVFLTTQHESVEATAKRALSEGADVLGISGGDGSIGAVAKIALEHKLPMVVLPGGTRCHFARDLGLEPKRIVDSLSAFHGVERHVDAGDINGRIFTNNVSFGLYADIVDNSDYREHKVRVSMDTMRALASGKKDLYDLQFKHGDIGFQSAAQVLVGVNRYDTVDLFELGHRERLDEGVLQVIVITKLNDRVIKELVAAISVDKLFKHAHEQDIYQWTASTFTLRNTFGKLPVGVDGECEQYTSPVTISVLPQALHIFVPAEAVEGRASNPLSTPVLRKVRQGALH